MAACCNKLSNLPCSPQTNSQSNLPSTTLHTPCASCTTPAHTITDPMANPPSPHCGAGQHPVHILLSQPESLENFTIPQAETAAASQLVPVRVAAQHMQFIRQCMHGAHQGTQQWLHDAVTSTGAFPIAKMQPGNGCLQVSNTWY